MKKLTAVLLVLCMAFGLFATGCQKENENVTVKVEDESYYSQYKDKGYEINVYNWGEYISTGADDTMDVIGEFEKLSGIKVNYTNFATNEELYAKLRTGAVSYDVIIPSDYMIGRMAKEGMLEPLNLENIPNYKFIDPQFTSKSYDPDNTYSVPYTWGTVGIIYNKTMVDEADVDTWDILWNEKYAGNILMFSNSRDAFGIALMKLGYNVNTEDEGEIKLAAEELKKQKPVIQAYVMDEIFDKMESGEAAVAPYYAGDAITMIAEAPDLAFSVPKEGTNLFIDAMCIPKGAKNKELAEVFINFMCETEVAKANIETIGYSTPQVKALEALDEDLRNNPIAYPPEDVIQNTQVFENLSDATNKLYDKLWTEILASSGH